jgi:hypothetical protein
MCGDVGLHDLSAAVFKSFQFLLKFEFSLGVAGASLSDGFAVGN